jgi:hypothetical protein
MEILHRGTPPSEREFIGGCGNCNTRVKFTQSEGTVSYDQRDGDFISVECPVCQSTITVGIGQFIRPNPTPTWRDIDR